MRASFARGIEVRATLTEGDADVLTPDALTFLGDLHREFEPRRRGVLEARARRQRDLDAGMEPDFPAATKSLREGSWRVPPAPPDLRDRRVEITGPVDRKMMINALNSGAQVFMADFEDALAPTWRNILDGQRNLTDAVRGRLAYTSPDGRKYALRDRAATLLVRPRGWHLDEPHVTVDGSAVSASLFDAGLYAFHNLQERRRRGTGLYVYLPKLEGASEARLWHEVFTWVEDRLGVPRGTVRATVLIETVLAAFEMEEILHALGPHATGLNAGRWDYIFSLIKKFRNRPGMVLPDRSQVTMDVPFMRAYAERLVQTCHRRGAHAIGGMAAFIPNRKDAAVTEGALAKVREDKRREAAMGFDGTWVAHPDLVPVAADVFDQALQGRPDQLGHPGPARSITAPDLLDVRIPGSAVTSAGLRTNVNVGLQYIESWLRGNGAAAIHNLMEDTATAEICRAQIWQWVRHGIRLREGATVTRELVGRTMEEESAALAKAWGPEATNTSRLKAAREVFERVALDPAFVEFLTIPAYAHLE